MGEGLVHADAATCQPPGVARGRVLAVHALAGRLPVGSRLRAGCQVRRRRGRRRPEGGGMGGEPGPGRSPRIDARVRRAIPRSPARLGKPGAAEAAAQEALGLENPLVADLVASL